MKNFNKLASMTLALTLVFSGCTKDEVNPKNSHNQDYHQVQRSGYSDIELLGMAANIDEIQFRNGSYTVSFHGSATSYSVDIVSFNLDSIIEISISHGVVVSEALVDFDGETLDIGNDQYSFEDINLIQISSSSDNLLKVTAAVVVQHLENPRQTISFYDNGSSDFFPIEEGEYKKCCICSHTTTNEFFPGLCTDTTTQTIFWITLPGSTGDPYAC